MKSRVAGCVLALCAGCVGVVAAQSPATAEEAAAELVRQQIAEHGEITDPALNTRVRHTLAVLHAAARTDGPPPVVTLIKSEKINAWALGGRIVVYQGLLSFADSVARATHKSDSAASRLRDAFVAGVVAHEFAHLLLRHSEVDSVPGCLRAIQDESAVTRAAGSTGGGELHINRRLIACLRMSRDRELAADHVGALMVLSAARRGQPWSLEAMQQFWLAQDRLMRRAGREGLADLTYVVSHPRDATRRGYLDFLRGQLMLDQARFDDALILIDANAEIDLALALLDSVMLHFPELPALRHARATALARQWLNGVPVAELGVRPTLATIPAAFAENVRGGTSSTQALTLVSATYDSLLAEREHPYVLANAAVTDAYAGRLDRAEARARRALALRSEDPLVINALGVVLFRRGKYPEAAEVFGSGLQGAVAPTSVALAFNRGRSLHAAGDTAAAEALLSAVLVLEPAGPWADETLRLLQRAPRPAGSAPPAPGLRLTGSGAPLQLGTTAAEVRRRLGAPSTVERSGAATLWHFDAAGVVAAFDESGRAVMFSLLRRAAGEIDGVHVGDNLRQVEAAWGPPSGGDATARIWQDGSGVARLVQVLDDAVHTIMLVRAAT